MSFQEFLDIILKNKKAILRIALPSVILFFLLLTFLYPLTYSSVVKILPPEPEKMAPYAGLLMNSDLIDITGTNTPGMNSQLFAEIVKSRSAAEYVVEKCGLVNFYGAEDKTSAAYKLMKHLDVEVNKEGIISLSVDVSTPLFGRLSPANDSTRNFSAVLSNAYAEALDYLNREKLNSRAKRVSGYLSQQIIQTGLLLDSVETALKTFQEKNKAISLPEQLTTSIEAAANLKSEIIITEIQLGTLSTNLNKNSSTIEGLNKKLAELKKQYSKIETGGKLDDDYLPGFSKVPRVSLDLARLLRDVKIQNEVYLLLQKQYYSEKLQENKNISTIEILDPAISPLKAKSPDLIVHTLLGGLIIFMLVIIYIALQDKKFRRTS